MVAALLPIRRHERLRAAAGIEEVRRNPQTTVPEFVAVESSEGGAMGLFDSPWFGLAANHLGAADVVTLIIQDQNVQH